MVNTPKKTNLYIESLGPKGDGVAFSRKGPIYVDRSAPRDEVSVNLFRDRLGIQRGDIVQLIKPSPYRQTPPCQHFEKCGNCTLQHLNQEFYQHWKVNLVKEALKNVSMRPRKWLSPIFLSGSNRRRLTFTLRNNNKKTVLGYYQRRSQELTEIKSCEIALPELLTLKETLRPFLKNLTTGQQNIDISFQWVDNKADMVISGLTGGPQSLDKSFLKFLKSLTEVTPVARISLKQKEKFHILIQKEPITKQFGPLSVNLPPGAFLQPTQEGEAALVDCVLSALPEGKKFADLFSGCGTFTGALMTRGEVDAFESSALAVESLSKSSQKFPIRAFRRDLFKNPIHHKDLNQFDAIVFDPPRAGSAEQAQEMALSNCKTLIGVSCNPATFARDAKILSRGGYRLQTAQVIDQFLWSHHVEIVGVFEKGR